MSDIPDAVGNLAQGALWSGAIEPRNGGSIAVGADGHTHESACLNCGTSLVGPHCHACGQHAHVHRTLGAFLHDLLHGALHFEGKTWHTLPLLAVRPGELTRRYIAGQRARFVSPMALFLFCVFLMFAVFQIVGIAPPSDFGATGQIYEGVDEQVAALEAQADSLREQRDALAEEDPQLAGLNGRIAGIEEQIMGIRSVAPNGEIDLDTGVPFIDHAVEKWQKNPSLMAYKLQANSYKFSWLLIPLSIPFVALLFAWRRKFGAYDHAVFVTYSLSFMTLFYVSLVLLGKLGLGGGVLGLLGITIPLLHIYKQLKGAYGLSRFSAAWRTLVLTMLIFVILFVFIDLLLVLGALG
jgi:hypothetical protein